MTHQLREEEEVTRGCRGDGTLRRSPPPEAPTRDALLDLAAQLYARGGDLQVVARQVAALADRQIGPLELSSRKKGGQKASDAPKHAA